ncbi:Mitochondrial distribution and morphology protein 31, mitochondrial precursor [Dimargaris verticillata]|uniref:Mitochondrial distribution and morphology protein 31, mitochondrial n=1 Tax=Dimargaris verticillata TaxID=2761393 RepID=A0A9W8EFG2_9FUNG|nr:Mitochondrial distribution and morphology protein 31, mitochondrial precursor [Dimargaris verticillata]
MPLLPSMLLGRLQRGFRLGPTWLRTQSLGTLLARRPHSRPTLLPRPLHFALPIGIRPFHVRATWVVAADVRWRQRSHHHGPQPGAVLPRWTGTLLLTHSLWTNGTEPSPRPIDTTFSSRPVAPSASTSAREDKQRLLRTAPNRFARLRVHARYVLLRSFNRPFTLDEILGIFSWIFLSNTIFILIGTTTFVSLVLAIAHGLSFEDYLATKLSEHLMDLTGATFMFESSISPSWRSGVISLRNVSVHLGPEYADRVKELHHLPHDNGQSSPQFDQAHQLPFKRFDDHYHVEQYGDNAPMTAHAAMESSEEGIAEHQRSTFPGLSREEVNYTMYDLKVNQIDVTLSLWRWMDGKGLIKDCSIRGVRGVIDRTHVFWDPLTPYDPVAERDKHRQVSGFEIDSFHLEDMLVYVYYPDAFPPFPVSIYSASLPQLRQRWFLLDVLSADSMVGTYDNCLFSIHQAQDPQSTLLHAAHRHQQFQPLHPWQQKPVLLSTETDMTETPNLPSWRHGSNLTHSPLMPPSSGSAAVPTDRSLNKPCPTKRSHLRIDGVNISHLNAGTEGPFGWITDGQVDVNAIISFPNELDQDPLKRLVHELTDDLESAMTQSASFPLIAGFQASRRQDQPTASAADSATDHPGTSDALAAIDAQSTSMPTRSDQPVSDLVASSSSASEASSISPAEPVDPTLWFDLNVTFNNTRASVPLQTEHISYLNNALIRPIVAYVNAHRTVTSIPCRFTLKASDFDGSWSFYDCGFVDKASTEIGKGFVKLAYDERERNRHLKRVGLWSVQTVTRNIISLMYYVRGKRGFWHYLGIVNDYKV